MTQLGFRITHVAEVRIGAQAFGVDDFAAKRLAAAIDFDAPALAARRPDTGDVGRGRGGRERHGGEKEQRSLHAASPLTLPASSRRSASSSNGRSSSSHGWKPGRSEEHTSELQSLMRISYAVFCLQKKNNTISTSTITS